MAQATDTNRLINETSPYLLQHAHNPVDWWPWGEEVFNAARHQDKPIFLSVGYSTCYWCHVMERECFENEAIAKIMNEHFINIKVDREERPDVDDVYMTATQLMTQHGGWPMSVWLEPKELKPFLAGTYFPPDDRHGRPSFPSVLLQIARAWREQRDVVERQAEQVAEAVKHTLESVARPSRRGESAHGGDASANVLAAIDTLMRLYDREHGGFGGAQGPKFPTPVNLDFLLGVAWKREGETPVLLDARKAVLHTLDRKAIGGMYDQIGGGFHRYSVDEQWLVPHFEKMLYDNAQLSSTYARAFELTKDTFYAEIVRETLDYVLREMTDERGGFFSAQDAEVNAREGQNYLWTATEVREALAEAGLNDLIDFTLHVYGFDRGPNFRDPHHPEDESKNVVHLIDRQDRLAASLHLTQDEFNSRIEKVNRALLTVRNKRDQPSTDDKVLAGWNGLMIAGMADGGRVLSEPKYIEAAERAALFVLDTMGDDNGRLLRSYRMGDAKINAFAEDYAFVIRGLLALHSATRSAKWIGEARRLTQAMRGRFFDRGGGGYYDTETGQSELFVRTKGVYDGAVPSANSVMLLNLIDLHDVTGEEHYVDDALATVGALGRMIEERPVAVTLGVLGLSRMIERWPERVALGGVGAVGSRETAGGVVRVTAEPESVEVRSDRETSIHVKFEIAQDYHINAHDIAHHGLMPLSIEVQGEGVIGEVMYPPGEPYANDPSLRIHRDAVSVLVRLIASKAGDGPPRIIVTYQACSEGECLEPRTIMIPLAIH